MDDFDSLILDDEPQETFAPTSSAFAAFSEKLEHPVATVGEPASPQIDEVIVSPAVALRARSADRRHAQADKTQESRELTAKESFDQMLHGAQNLGLAIMKSGLRGAAKMAHVPAEDLEPALRGGASRDIKRAAAAFGFYGVMTAAELEAKATAWVSRNAETSAKILSNNLQKAVRSIPKNGTRAKEVFSHRLNHAKHLFESFADATNDTLARIKAATQRRMNVLRHASVEFQTVFTARALSVLGKLGSKRMGTSKQIEQELRQVTAAVSRPNDPEGKLSGTQLLQRENDVAKQLRDQRTAIKDGAWGIISKWASHNTNKQMVANTAWESVSEMTERLSAATEGLLDKGVPSQKLDELTKAVEKDPLSDHMMEFLRIASKRYGEVGHLAESATARLHRVQNIIKGLATQMAMLEIKTINEGKDFDFNTTMKEVLRGGGANTFEIEFVTKKVLADLEKKPGRIKKTLSKGME